MCKYPFQIAAPSWVLPADAKDNVIFLNHKVLEVELLCFEPTLPLIDDFPTTNLTWHLHLPSSVPMDFFQNKEKYIKLLPFHEENIENIENIQWKNPWVLAQNMEDIDFYASCCVRIFEHCEKLKPWLCVVHLPPIYTAQVEEKLAHFIEYWQSHFPLNTLALENVRDAAHQDFQNLLSQKIYKNLHLCLDVAHAITYGQKAIIDNKLLMDKVALTHWSAPYPNIYHEKVVDIHVKTCSMSHKAKKNKKAKLSAALDNKTSISTPNDSIDTKSSENIENKDMHLPLYHLKHERAFCQQIINRIPRNTVHVIEVFNWQGIEDSMDFFYSLIREENSPFIPIKI